MALQKQKGSKNWYAVINVNGKQIWRSTRTANRVKAELFEAELKYTLHKGKNGQMTVGEMYERINPNIASQRLLIESVWETYLNNSAFPLAKSTNKAKKKRWNQFRKWIQKNTCIKYVDEIDKMTVKLFFNALQADGSSMNNYNNLLSTLRTIIDEVMEEAGITKNPFRYYVRRLKNGTQKCFRKLLPQEVRRLFDIADEDWKGCILIAVYTALRKKDICHLKWCDIDFNSKKIIKTPSKTKKHQIVTRMRLHSEIEAYLSELERTSEYIFPNIVSRSLKSSFDKEFSQLLAGADIHKNENGIVGFHSLRDTSNSKLEDLGTSKDVRKKILGHRDDNTHDIYSQGQEEVDNAINRLPKFDDWFPPST